MNISSSSKKYTLLTFLSIIAISLLTWNRIWEIKSAYIIEEDQGLLYGYVYRHKHLLVIEADHFYLINTKEEGVYITERLVFFNIWNFGICSKTTQSIPVHIVAPWNVKTTWDPLLTIHEKTISFTQQNSIRLTVELETN